MANAQLVNYAESERLDQIHFGSEFSFIAFGRQFDIELQRNDAIIRNLPADARELVRDIELYRGVLTGVAGSWVRLTRHNNAMRALIWDGLNYYSVRTAPGADKESLDAQSQIASDHSYIIRRLHSSGTSRIDRVIRPREGSASIEPLSPVTADASRNLNLTDFPMAAAVVQTPVLPGKQIDIGLVADFELYSHYGGEITTTALLEIANAVDGIFVQRLGIHLNVTLLEVMTTNDQPFTYENGTLLLSEVATYKNSSTARRELGLLHLFTGKSITNLDLSGEHVEILGLANIGSVCDSQFGVALTQARNPEDAVFIAAHEIGHNLGAPHDGEADSSCSAEPTTFLMAPNLNYSDQFSSCSIGQMLPDINAGTCLSTLPANDVAVRPLQEPDQPVPLEGVFDAEFVVENLGVSTAYGVQVSILPNGVELVYANPYRYGQYYCQQDTATTAIDCYFYDFEAGSQIPILFRAVGSAVGPATIRIDVLSLSDENSSNDSYVFEFDVAASVDFAFNGSTQSNRIIHPEETSEVLLRVLNRGGVTATNTVAEISASLPYEIVEARTPAGEPCPASQTTENRWECQLGSVAIDQPLEIPVTIRGVVEEEILPGNGVTGSINLKIFADEPEKDFNEWSHSPVIVASTFADLVPELIVPPTITAEDPFSITVIGRNMGPDVVADAILTFSHGALEVISFTSDNANCGFNDRTRDYDCTAAELLPGGDISVTMMVRFIEDPPAGISAVISGLTYDSRTGNNRENLLLVETEVIPETPPVPDPSPAPPAAPASSGGGGGSTGLLWMMFLSLVAFGRSRAHSLRIFADSKEATRLLI